MTTVLTAWKYDLSLLELIAFVTSVVGVALGIFGPRSTWPWWNISSSFMPSSFSSKNIMQAERFSLYS